jgi:hypothetical protein
VTDVDIGRSECRRWPLRGSIGPQTPEAEQRRLAPPRDPATWTVKGSASGDHLTRRVRKGRTPDRRGQTQTFPNDDLNLERIIDPISCADTARSSFAPDCVKPTAEDDQKRSSSDQLQASDLQDQERSGEPGGVELRGFEPLTP